VPVSKKRKPKRRNTAPVKSGASGIGASTVAGKGKVKKKLSRQQIIIYLISFAMILSLAISFLVGNSGPSGPVPTPTVAGVEAPAPAGTSTEEAQPAPTTEPTEAN
jgi:hypothetical protein